MTFCSRIDRPWRALKSCGKPMTRPASPSRGNCPSMVSCPFLAVNALLVNAVERSSRVEMHKWGKDERPARPRLSCSRGYSVVGECNPFMCRSTYPVQVTNQIPCPPPMRCINTVSHVVEVILGVVEWSSRWLDGGTKCGMLVASGALSEQCRSVLCADHAWSVILTHGARVGRCVTALVFVRGCCG